ncbi:MAG TPA: SRPBCC domain-containing protein [Acidimicrobiales bacterium]|jgi:uncharacterized protein YndB with AHSA1/START domain|nr:SRPBCC domain-containing protein [Acidimicrobiales bacterium]
MINGRLETNGVRATIRFERLLPHPPEAVWRSLVDRDELNGWFPTDIITDEWKVGATLTFVFRENQAPEFSGTVLELDEPRLLAYTWGDETLRFVLTPRPGGATHLVLTDELDPGIAARNAAGWETCLAHLAGESPDGEWKPLFDRYAAAFEPALGPQEGPPPGFDAHD